MPVCVCVGGWVRKLAHCQDNTLSGQYRIKRVHLCMLACARTQSPHARSHTASAPAPCPSVPHPGAQIHLYFPRRYPPKSIAQVELTYLHIAGIYIYSAVPRWRESHVEFQESHSSPAERFLHLVTSTIGNKSLTH